MTTETKETRVPTVEEIKGKLYEVEDPEIRMNIMDLGLVYDVNVDEEGYVKITMTLTSPGCPLGPVIQGQAWAVLSALPGVKDVDVEIVWTPPWDPKTMASDEVKMMLGIW